MRAMRAITGSQMAVTEPAPYSIAPVVGVYSRKVDDGVYLRHFARCHHCVTFGARGYPPSDVPKSVEAYSKARAVADILAAMDHLTIDRAHIVGLSMGGFAAAHFGLDHPDRARSLVIAGAGYGAEK
jgi:pimeloyl-ACP methyl ester carboxylesterase